MRWGWNAIFITTQHFQSIFSLILPKHLVLWGRWTKMCFLVEYFNSAWLNTLIWLYVYPVWDSISWGSHSVFCCVYTWLFRGDHVSHCFYKLSIYKNEVLWLSTLFYYSALHLPPLPPAPVFAGTESRALPATHTIKWGVMKLCLWYEQMEGWGDGKAKWEEGRVHSVFLWEQAKFY